MNDVTENETETETENETLEAKPMGTLAPWMVEEILNDNPEIRQKVLDNLKAKSDSINATISALEGGSRGTRRAGRKPSAEITDGKTHPQAVLDAMAKLPTDGVKSRQLHAMLETMGHPIKGGILGTTLQNLCNQGKVIKVQAEAGKRGNLYYLPTETAKSSKKASKKRPKKHTV